MKNLKRKIKKSARKIMASFLLVTTLVWSLGVPLTTLIPEANASTPTIVVVELVNPSAVEVIFSEAMTSASAQDSGNYTFNGGLTVIDAVQQGSPNVFRIVASGSITPGATTLTVSSSVLALSDNDPNTSTLAQAIINPVRVKISEVVAGLDGAANKEFVELYNAGGQAIDLSGYKLHFRDGSETDTNKTLDFASNSASDTIPAYGFFLIASSQYTDIGTTPDATYTAESNDLADNGSVYLSTSDTALTDVIDKVGFGSQPSNGYEGTAVANLSAGQSIERKSFGGSQATDMATGGMDAGMGNGWDTSGNSFDFVVQATPNPQNSSSATEQPNFDDYDGAAGDGPMIMHMPINSAVTGGDLSVTAQMGDPTTPLDQIVAELHYMIGDSNSGAITGLTDFTTTLGAHQSNGFFNFTVPQAAMDHADTDTYGLFYYLKVVTDGGTGFMSASPSADTGTYDTVALQEAAVAINPFIISVDAAGDTFAISGTITDDTPVAIESVSVFIEGTGYSATTNGSGFYTISVPNGIYNITMAKTGYYEEMINDIFVNGAAVTGVDRTMYLGTGGGMTGDSEKPMVMWTGPMDGMMGVPSGMDDFKVFVGFSKDLDTSTFNPTSVILTSNPSGDAMAGYSAQYNPTRTEYMPPESMDPYLGVISLPNGGGGFAENTTYYLIMNGTIRDTAGNALQGNRPDGGHMISFTAGGTFTEQDMMGDDFGTGAMMPPFVVGTNPYDGAMGVMTNAKININFSDTMDSTTVTSTNIKLYKITYANYAETKTAVALSSVSLDTVGQNATLTPAEVLTAGAKYRVVVSGALKSATGIWMGDPGQSQNTAAYEFYWSEFEVGTSSDSAAPTVLGSWPANGATGITVNPGMMTIQFSEGMDPATINSNTITLKRGTSAVTGNINYDPMSQSASFSPSVVLATSTDYTLTVTTSVTDAVGNAIASNVIIFTTGSDGDDTDPSIMFANGDEYGVAITFSEAMNSANVADATGYLTSVLNPANYVIKQGPAGTTDWSGISGLVLTSAQFQYDGMGNTIMIDNIPGTTIGNDYYIDTTSTTVSGAGVADLSGNDMTSNSTFQMPINNSFDTQGMLGPMMGGDMMGPDMGMMGMMGAGVFPMNGMAGQTTIYFVDVPTTKAIPNTGTLVLTFPVGFDVSGAKKDPYSPINNDVNEWNSGTIAFGSAAETSGGADNDGVTVNSTTRTITITFAVSGDAVPTADFLHLDLAGIVNSSIPRGFETSGYTVDMKTMDASGNLLETINAMPFFINAGGDSSLSGNITGIEGGDVDGTGDTVMVFLGSPMTGPMEATATIVDAGTGSYSFSGLTTGQYMIFTDPTITLDNNDYEGMPMPQPITITSGANTKHIALTKAGTGDVATITVNITGEFGTDDIDIFAGSPTGFKVKTINSAGTNPNPITLYLTDGDWMIGMGPAMPKGPMAGPPPMPDWMPPMPTNIVVSGDGATILEKSNSASITGGNTADGTITFAISTADMMNIIGYVTDGVATDAYPNGTPIADAEAFAYQPMGMGMGSHSKTDTDGKFTLKVASAGTYSVGVFKPGLPGVPDRTVKVSANAGAVDGNDTADITVDSVSITTANKFIFKIQKPDWTISGKVTNGTNPVSYAPVWAYQPNGMGHADTMTDASGNYILYVANGNWTVQSYIPGYGDSELQTVVVNGASMTQNLAPDSSVTYYTISGEVSLNNSAQTYMPIRAVKYDNNGNYTGQEYGGQTDASGDYSISVPPGKYRVDIWTPEFGEVELTVTDEVANSPANVLVVNANKTGKNIIISEDNLKPVAIKFTNGTATQTGIVNVDGLSCSGNICNPTGFHKTIKLSALNADSSVKLPVGDYLFFLDVQGAGFFIPDEADAVGNTKHCITVVGGTPATWVEGVVSLTDNTVEFDLPATTGGSQEIFTISGTITDSADSSNIDGAWVWMGNPTTGVHTGATTNSSGVYSITVKEGTYKMGVEVPEYMPQQPTEIIVATDVTEQDYSLTSASQFITGVIYADADDDDTYDSNEEIADGWVWVEETTTKQIAGAPADVDGVFSIGVVNGTYILRGVAEGYQETKFGAPITVGGAGSTGNNINLTVDSNWSSKLKSRPMTPASGGTIDDSLSAGTGIKVVAPPNALGSGTSAGNINTKEISSVSKTSSADPFGGKGKEITAQDNSGQAITTLNSDIEIELNYYKGDVTDAGTTDLGKLKLMTNSYWDASIGDWVPMSTTKKAFTKAVGAADDAEWVMQPNFDTFVNELITDTDAYGDYKITLQSTVGHLTIFGATTPSDLIAPSAPSNLSQTSGNGTSVVLDWDNNSEIDLLEYEIYRSDSSGVTAIDANQKNTSQVTASTFTDSTTMAVWTSYYYTVTAVDDSGNESGVATEIQVCSNSTVSNGTVDTACSITCDSGYNQSGNSCVAQGGGGSAGGSTPTSTIGQAVATPSAGGTISRTNSDGSSAKVVFPVDALSENATITVSPKTKTSIIASRPVSSGKSVVGNYVYQLTAVSGIAAVSSFQKAVRLTFTYTNQQAEGFGEENFRIHYWNETSEQWVALEDNIVDTVNNTVTATIDHFTYFTILGTQTEDGETTGGEIISDIIDGDIIQCQNSSNPFAVYIVKIVGDTKYIRHIVSLEIFNYYGHLQWENLEQVNSLDEYSLSGWARVNTGPNGTPGPTDKVYEINGDQSKHWINMTAEDFLTHGGSEPAIYSVNQGELNLYTTGADVMSL